MWRSFLFSFLCRRLHKLLDWLIELAGFDVVVALQAVMWVFQTRYNTNLVQFESAANCGFHKLLQTVELLGLDYSK
jgi:hypothetical protein